ncbi:unnamed protein product [Linum tenue]|uniref:Uncharacterized protein n=1 Tax=Linum tenue TaxID=586396 RepID=A0AAV0NMH5_9ROSI|nr:unnamed protein product [Linum tenue]
MPPSSCPSTTSCPCTLNLCLSSSCRSNHDQTRALSQSLRQHPAHQGPLQVVPRLVPRIRGEGHPRPREVRDQDDVPKREQDPRPDRDHGAQPGHGRRDQAATQRLRRELPGRHRSARGLHARARFKGVRRRDHVHYSRGAGRGVVRGWVQGASCG